MKKYLMTGVAAIALCAGFTSCSHDVDGMSQEELNEHYVQKIVESYEKAFIENIGQPAPYQDWGFGSSSEVRTRGVYTNANQWAAPKDNQNIQTGWEVPDTLTDKQQERVYRYFQTHPYLSYKDPKWTNYFVQQVYKGGTDVLETSDGLGAVLSTEQYAQATTGSTPFKGSGNMDYLTFGSNGNTYFDHCNNFNAADGGRIPVLDNGQPLNGGTTHMDEIMLMYQSKTDCVGFHDSRSNTYHYNKHCALVGYAVIDAWADSVANATGIVIGEPVTDKWKRSFVGLDYESSTLETAYARNSDNSIQYAKIGDFATTSVQYAYLGKNDKNEDVFVKWADYTGKETILTNALGEPVPYLDVNGSEIIGTVEGGGKNAYTHDMSVPEYENNQWTNQTRACLDVPMLLDLARNGMPNKRDEYKFIVNPGGRDYVFSDWIVTLCEAKQTGSNPPVNPPTTGKIRVIAEDLTATTGNDFDFNDIVFDVTYGEANVASITVQAAGGTLPLRIKVGAGNTEADYQEVHALWEQSPSIMINTHAENRYPGRGVSNLPAKNVTLGYAVKTPTDVRDLIKIEVQKSVGNTLTWVELKSERGKPAAKIAVNPDWHWLDERVNITTVSGFVNYVTNGDTWEGSLPQ